MTQEGDEYGMLNQRGAGAMSIDLGGAKWHKSRHSGPNQSCVEVACNLSGVVGVRDSKDRQGPALVFTRHEWNTFFAAVKADEAG